MLLTRPPETPLPPDFDPYQVPAASQTETFMEHSKLADIATGSAWGFGVLSLAQVNEVLQMLALLVTIASGLIAISIHVRRWLQGRK